MNQTLIWRICGNVTAPYNSGCCSCECERRARCGKSARRVLWGAGFFLTRRTTRLLDNWVTW